MSEEAKPEIVTMHAIRRGDQLYVLLEDITTYLKELGETEEIDVRNRLDEAIFELMKLKNGKKN